MPTPDPCTEEGYEMASESEDQVESTAEELVEFLLNTVIANLGYPVGMGIAPHPDTVNKLATHCAAIVRTVDAEQRRITT